LTPQQFNTWIRPLALESAADGYRLLAQNRFVLQWVKERFLTRISEIAAQAEGRPVSIALAITDGASDAAQAGPAVTAPSRAVTPPAATETPSGMSTPPALPRRHEQTSLNPSFTFATFVAGKANQLARAAALQVAEHPTSYNPLFVYGGVGLGKTHLIQALGNHILQRDGAAKIRYIHAETYVSDVVRAYQHKAFDDFKRYYRSLDLPAVARLCDAFLDVNVTDELRRLDAPACIVVGDQDLLKGPRYADILHRAIRGSRMHVLAGAGHAASWEAPAEFNRVVLQFLAAQPG
jgi:chromosomal replication initiator protein